MPADASTHEPSQFDVGYAIAPVRRVVSRENIDAYRWASGDHNRIHYDDEFAASTRFGGVISHGLLTLAMISEMMAGEYGSCWLRSGSLRVRFRGAAYPGDLLAAAGAVTKSESTADGSRVTCDVELRNVDNGNRIITGSATVVVSPADMRERAE
jgi:acyl dehydratase